MSPPSPLSPMPVIENGDAAPPPEEKTGESNISPLKAAADLIQTLDIAYVEMTHCAADAARDAETARRNARAASEIARRYLHRSYPKTQSPFGGGTSTTTTPSPQQWSSSSPSRQDDHKSSQLRVESKEGDPLGDTINEIATDLQTTTTPLKKHNHHKEHNSSKFNFETAASSRSANGRDNPYNRPYKTTPSTKDRIAQSHAEDVLTLSMELERSKQAMQSEQRMHDDTKASLASYKSKHKSLEEQNQKILSDLETYRQDSEQQISEFEQELAKSRLRLQATEEDAQLALDLAKESADSRDQVEEWLQKALEELRVLKEEKTHAAKRASPHSTPRRSVRFADQTPPKPPPPMEVITPTRGGPSRSMVAAGRQLLRRSMGSSPDEEIITLELTPAKSAERRRRLRERLTQLEGDDVPTPQRSPQHADRSNSSSHSKTMEECQNAAKLLQESGQRLDLGGHWWRDKGGMMVAPHEKLYLEAMTRQFCQSVEFKIERQHKDINELESLCGFLEKKLVTGSD